MTIVDYYFHSPSPEPRFNELIKRKNLQEEAIDKNIFGVQINMVLKYTIMNYFDGSR